MKLPRPYIPVDVRLEVIVRQCHAMVPALAFAQALYPVSKGERLKRLLALRFDGQPVHLDHDPPLGARAMIPARADDPRSFVHAGRIRRYQPDANDPRYLVYRVKEEHRVKTFVRGERGQHSDVALIKRARRRQRKGKRCRGRCRWLITRRLPCPGCNFVKRKKGSRK